MNEQNATQSWQNNKNFNQPIKAQTTSIMNETKLNRVVYIQQTQTQTQKVNEVDADGGKLYYLRKVAHQPFDEMIFFVISCTRSIVFPELHDPW